MTNKKSVREWAEDAADKLLEPMLDKLDKLDEVKTEEEMALLVSHLSTVMVHRLVLNSLTVTEKQATTLPEQELYALVKHKFTGVKTLVEDCIVQAFEVAIAQAANKETMYTCKIVSVTQPANTMPC